MGSEKGSAPCDEEATIPIAVKFADDRAKLDTYKANVATESGADLPAIFGSASMQEKDSVLILRKGKEMIAFPGPGGYTIEWSLGTKLLPMTAAPSGHLVIPCDHFHEAVNAKPAEPLVFHIDHTNVGH